MTEPELLAKIATEGWTVLNQTTTGQEGTGDNLLTHKAVAATKASDGVLDRRWFKYYLKIDGTCYWQEYNPFPGTPPITFAELVRDKITSMVSAGTIKAGYVEKVDETSRTALVAAVKADKTTSLYHVYDVVGVLTVDPVTGTYPI